MNISWDDEKPKTGGIKWDDETQTPEKKATETPKAAPVSRMEKFAKGAMDPYDAGAQILEKAMPDGVVKTMNEFNNWLADRTGLVGKLPEGGVSQFISEKEKAYQASRAASGEAGIDAYRLAGNIAATAPLAVAAPAATLGGRVVAGAATGAGFSALQPVTEGDFLKEKAKQVGLGTVVGAAAPVVLSGLARVVSPKASVNPQLKALQAEGVQPTVGQAIGGRAAIAEEKLQSVPILGDMIHRARNQTLESFNKSAINRALAPVGAKVEGVGHEAIRKAGDTLSQYYDDALNQVKGVKFDNRFDSDLNQLKQMATNLVPDMGRKFDKVLSDTVMGRMSPSRSMLADVYKSVDSDLGKIASRYSKSSTAAEQELGDALTQIQSLMKQQMMRSNPHVADMVKRADRGWANLVRIEQAAKSAKNNEGIFTPAQLNSAIQMADDSVRGRAVSRGTALMQDLGSAGQKVLGSKYPDSGTVGRLALGGAAIGAGAINPAIPVGLAAGGAMYTRPVQNALVKMLTERPQSANAVADILRQLSPYGAAALAPLANSSSGP